MKYIAKIGPLSSDPIFWEFENEPAIKAGDVNVKIGRIKGLFECRSINQNAVITTYNLMLVPGSIEKEERLKEQSKEKPLGV